MTKDSIFLGHIKKCIRKYRNRINCRRKSNSEVEMIRENAELNRRGPLKGH